MQIYSHLQALGANVDFTPYETNAVVSLAPPENRFAADSNGVEYFALIELQVYACGYNNRDFMNHCGEVDFQRRVTPYKKVGNTITKLPYFLVGTYATGSSVQFVGDTMCVMFMGTNKLQVMDLLTGDVSQIDAGVVSNGGHSYWGSGSLYVGGRKFAAFTGGASSAKNLQLFDVTDPANPVLDSSSYGYWCAAKGDLLATVQRNLLTVQPATIGAQGMVEFGVGVSQAVTPSYHVVTFSSDENVALMLGAGYVTVDRQTWSSQVHYRQTIGVFPADKTNREICPWWSLDKNVLICGDGYGNPPVAGIQVWNVSAGTEKSANSDWAAAQGLVSDTTPIVFSDDSIITLHHQALVLDQAGKVTQVGYVDMDTPSTIASVSARDADWWHEPAQSVNPLNSQVSLTRHTANLWEFKDKLGATVQLARSHSHKVGSKFRFWFLSDTDVDISQTIIVWRGYRASNAAYTLPRSELKYDSLVDLESVYHTSFFAGGVRSAAYPPHFACLVGVTQAQSYAPTSTTGGFTPLPPQSFCDISNSCINAESRSSFLSALANRANKNFIEAEIIDISQTATITYRVFIDGIEMASFQQTSSYVETLNPDGTPIATPADYTLELLVGTAYSTRELFVECVTGDLDLRQ